MTPRTREADMKTRFQIVALTILVITFAWVLPASSAGEVPVRSTGVLPPDVVEEFAGRPLPPLEALVEAGRLPASPEATASGAANLDPRGRVMHWLGHFTFLHGSLGDDLVGETSLQPVCGGQPISSVPDAPTLYWGYHSTGNVWSSSYGVPLDLETCSRNYKNLLKYYETQVWMEAAGRVRMLVGAGGGIRIWLNNEEVLSEYGPAEYEEDQYHADVDLQQGWNFIVVKFYVPDLTPPAGSSPASAKWSMRFTALDGTTPVDAVQSVDGWCTPGDGPKGWVFFNSAAHLRGVGSTWRSDLRLTNPYAHPVRVAVIYRPEGSVAAASGQSAPATETGARRTSGPATRTFILDTYETMTFNDLLPAMGVSGDQKGMLAVGGFDSTDAKERDVVNLRTYNQTSKGTFGTTIPPMRAVDGATRGNQVFLGVKNGPGFRTNLACTPLSALDDSIDFSVTIWDRASGTVKKKAFSGRGYFQINDVFRKLGLTGLKTESAVIFVSFEPSPSNGSWVFSATVNDNHSSDPVFVTPGYAIPLPSGS